MSEVLLIPVASPLHDSAAVRRVLDKYRICLEGCFDRAMPLLTGYNQLDDLTIEGEVLAIVAPLTGGTEHIIENIFEKIFDSGFILLAPHPTMNSLPAALEVFSALRESGKAWIIAEWPPGLRIKKFVRAWRTIQEIRGARVGLIGEPSQWLVYSSKAAVEERLREIFHGLTSVKINLEELYCKMKEAEDHYLHHIAEEVVKSVQATRVPYEEIKRALKVYLALRGIFEKYRLNAVSIGCFDIIKDADTTACLAASILNGEMKIVGCEGDLPALITMLLFSKLAGSSSFMGNLTWIEDDVITLAHCSAPMVILESSELDTHYESRKGVSLRGRFAKGLVVTLGRLDPLTRILRYAVGRILEHADEENVCRTHVSVRITGATRGFIEETIGNHYVMVPGDISEELAYVARIMNFRM